MHVEDQSRILVLMACGASTIASLLRIYDVCLLLNRGPDSRTARQMLYIKYHYEFLSITITYILLSLGAAESMGILAFVKRDIWLMCASGSVVLGSMIG